MKRKTHPLERMRIEKGLSKVEFSAQLGISVAFLSRVVNGQRRLGVDNALRASKLTGISLEDILQ